MRGKSRATGLLLEIIMTLLFFSITCATLLQIFAYTKQVSTLSSDKTRALACAQTIAEHFRAEETLDYSGVAQYPVYEDGSYTVYFDDDMKPAGQEVGGGYTANVDVSSQARTAGTMQSAHIAVEKDGQVLYEVTVDKYEGEGA